jgi:SM-20-related protein
MADLHRREILSERIWPRTARTIPIVLYDEFLVAEELHGLLRYSLRNAQSFVRSEVLGDGGRSGQDSHYRRSRVLFQLGPYQALFRQRLRTFLPHVLMALGKKSFLVADLELQLTASNHGEFFRPHTDSGDDEVRGRELTFVYFFHREPRRFAGGELRIFDTVKTEGHSTATERIELVYPLQNQIVFFPSSLLHEILPVTCPSKEFANSRFTVNGWYRR